LNTSLEIHSVQKGPQPSGGNKKGKNKNKNEANSDNNNGNNNNTQNLNNAGKDKKKKGKAKYPCKFCGEPHFLSECPKLAAAKKLYDQSRTCLQPIVLTNPLPTNHKMIVGTQNPRPQ